MEVTDIIMNLEKDVEEYFITDQHEVVMAILKAENALFLDTGFISRLAKAPLENIGDFIKAKCILIVTELVIYELSEKEEPRISAYSRALFQKISGQGFKLVLLKETTLPSQLGEYISKSAFERNRDFVGLLCKNKAALTSLAQAIENLPAKYQDVLGADYKVPKDADFTTEIIRELVSRKEERDSLAEELIIVCILLIMELPKGGKMFFCTHDHSSISRLNKAIQTSIPNLEDKVSAVSLYSFVAFLIKMRVLDESDKEEIATFLKKVYGNRIKVMKASQLPAQAIVEELAAEDITRGLFENVEYMLVLK